MLQATNPISIITNYCLFLAFSIIALPNQISEFSDTGPLKVRNVLKVYLAGFRSRPGRHDQLAKELPITK